MQTPNDAELLDSYLKEVDRRLPGSMSARRDVVDELRDGLLEAASALRQQGASRIAAMRLALAQFGTPDVVAAAHAPELAIRHARRSTWRVLGLLLTAGLTWQLGYKLALGVPPMATPDPGLSRNVFVIATGAVQYLPVLAEIGAIGFLFASVRVVPHRCGRRGFTYLAATVITGSLCAHLLAMAAVTMTGQPALWAGARMPVVLILLALVAGAITESVRVTRHMRVLRLPPR